MDAFKVNLDDLRTLTSQLIGIIRNSSKNNATIWPTLVFCYIRFKFHFVNLSLIRFYTMWYEWIIIIINTQGALIIKL